MITSWRQAFGIADLPFVFVQIGGYEDTSANTTEIRFAQADTLPDPSFSNATGITIKQTAMATTYDLGSPQPGHTSGWWIHCRNKTEVGRRVALQLNHLLLARASSAEWTGPLVQSIELDSDASEHPYATISMSHDAGLILAPAQGCVQCCDQDRLLYKGQRHLFEVANRHGKWLPAHGSVVGSGNAMRVVVRPKTNVTGTWLAAVRFAALDIPQCALYNSAELPAAPFEFPVPWKSSTLASIVI